jgi:YNFM family putative membrane transporter
MLMSGFVALYNYIGYHLLRAPYELSQAAVGWIFVLYLGSSIGGSAGGLAYSYAGWPGLVAMVAGLLILALISAAQLTLSPRAAKKDAG